MESIEKHIGKEITKAFDDITSHHTKTAIRDLEDFCIGTIKMNTETQKPFLTEKEYKYDVDLKKGILWQVWTKLRRDEYLEFIHDPKHMINPPEAILFETNFLEMFTKTPWWMIPLLWTPLILYNLYIAYTDLGFSVPILLVLYLLGILVWTLVEYLLHRFFFHLDEKLPDHPTAIMLHFLLHGIHHAFPMDKNRLVFPPVAAYPLYRLIKFSVWALFGNIFPVVMAGVITGYIGYDLTHYFIHHTKPANVYYKNLKQYHVLHHYNNPKRGFGVSNKLWDYVFNTVLEVEGKKQN